MISFLLLALSGRDSDVSFTMGCPEKYLWVTTLGAKQSSSLWSYCLATPGMEHLPYLWAKGRTIEAEVFPACHDLGGPILYVGLSLSPLNYTEEEFSFFNSASEELSNAALAGMAHLVGQCTADWGVLGFIPSWSTRLSVGLFPSWGCAKGQGLLFLSLSAPSLPLSLESILKKKKKKERNADGLLFLFR